MKYLILFIFFLSPFIVYGQIHEEAPDKKKEINHREPANELTKKISDKLPSVYVVLTAGASTFGTYSLGKVNSGGTFNAGADLAYFFIPGIGAGLKLNLGKCNVNFGEYFSYNETIIFIGPALYGRWGTNKIAFIASAGGGSLSWILSNSKLFDEFKKDESHSSFGGFISAGVNYMFTQNVGICLNINSALGVLEDEGGYERNPTGIGACFGLNFRF